MVPKKLEARVKKKKYWKVCQYKNTSIDLQEARKHGQSRENWVENWASGRNAPWMRYKSITHTFAYLE